MIFVLIVSILALSAASVWCGNSECKDQASKECATYRRRFPDFCTGIFKEFAEEKCKKTCGLCKDHDLTPLISFLQGGPNLHINQTDSEINELKKHRDELNARLTIMEKTLSKLIEELADMTKKHSDMTEKHNKMLSDMTEKHNDLTKKLRDMTEKHNKVLSDMTKKHNDLTKKLSDMTKKHNYLTKKLSDMDEKHNKKLSEMAEKHKEKFREMTEKHNKKLSETLKKYNALTKEVSDLKEKFASQAKKHGKLAESISNHQTKAKCLYGWTFHDGLCYKFFLETRTFWGAYGSCRDKGPGGDLAFIPNQSTQDFIVKDLIGRQRGVKHSVWFGMYKSKGVWWTFTGAKAGWFNWAPGEPRKDDVGLLWKKYDWKWDDTKYHHRNHYVCQMDPVV